LSDNYDILIGRDYLKDSNSKIDYEKETVMLGDTLLYIKYGENDIVKDKTAVKCLSPPSVDKRIEEDKTASECLNPPLSKDLFYPLPNGRQPKVKFALVQMPVVVVIAPPLPLCRWRSLIQKLKRRSQ